MIFELHSHTRFGSRCSYQHPEELIVQAKKVGLDGVGFTDHDAAWDRATLSDLSKEYGILVIGGMEVSTSLGEILVFGIHEPLLEVTDPLDLRKVVDRVGGVMVAAHPFRGARFSRTGYYAQEGLTVEEACERPIFEIVDGAEVFNGMAYDEEWLFTREVLRRLGMKGTGGSDTHQIDSVGICVTVFDRRIESQEQFIEEFKAGRFQAEHRVCRAVYRANGHRA